MLLLLVDIQPEFISFGPASILNGILSIAVMKYFGMLPLDAAIRKTLLETYCKKLKVP